MPPIQGAPPRPKGNRQKAVTFTFNQATPPYFKWKVVVRWPEAV